MDNSTRNTGDLWGDRRRRGSMTHRIRRLVGGLGLIGLAGGGLVAIAPAAHAATATVTSTTDGAPGSLRALISASNAGGAHTIDIPPGTYDLTIAPTGGDDNSSGDLNITQAATIVGTGGASQTKIVVQMADRAIMTQAHTTISGVTVTDGTAPSDEDGGDIYAPQGGDLTLTDSVLTNGTALGGGGLGAQSPLVAHNDTFSNNTAQAIPGNGSFGGGLLVTDNATIDSSTFNGNRAPGGSGGGVELDDFGPSKVVTLTNSTVTANTADSGPGVASANGGPSTLIYDTIAGNNGTNIGGGVLADSSGSNVTVTNTVLVGNTQGSTAANCVVQAGASIVSGGGNLSSDGTCASEFNHAADANSNTAAHLGALADNGGSTLTMLPGAGSSAIDTAPCLSSVTLDQRGWGRPYGPGCDKGALEVQPAPGGSTTTTAPGGSTGSTGPGGTDTTASPAAAVNANATFTG